MAVMQATVKRLTDVSSALTTLQACMILLSLWQLSAFAWAIPYFKLFIGALSHSLLLSRVRLGLLVIFPFRSVCKFVCLLGAESEAHLEYGVVLNPIEFVFGCCHLVTSSLTNHAFSSLRALH
jgi:hypothetical protein